MKKIVSAVNIVYLGSSGTATVPLKGHGSDGFKTVVIIVISLICKVFI